MNENKPFMDPDWQDIDDAPDLSLPEWQDKLAASPVRKGRPVSDNPKISTTIRLDADVINHFRAKGPGWQSKINAALKHWIASGH